jgi:hypothetical protein
MHVPLKNAARGPNIDGLVADGAGYYGGKSHGLGGQLQVGGMGFSMAYPLC